MRPKIKAIISYWRDVKPETDLACDWDEAHTHCWHCGKERFLEQAHITPRLNDTFRPCDVVLLCRKCHEQSPCSADPESMWRWLRATHYSPHRELIELLTELEKTHSLTVTDIQSVVGNRAGELEVATEQATESLSHHIGLSVATKTAAIYEGLMLLQTANTIATGENN